MRLQEKVVLCLTFVFYASGLRSCPENCQKAGNPTLSTCNRDTGACSRGCVPGYYGETCNMECDVNCQGRTCKQQYGFCKCGPGYTFNTDICERSKGTQCKWNENCLNNVCISENRDECSIGCRPGWFGGSCQQKCSEHCVCSRESGSCSSCEAGWYGEECESPCTAGCAGSNRVCERDGTCNQGCNSGYYGRKCELSCPNECKDRSCTRNGTCDACVKGFYGDSCHVKCGRCKDRVCNGTTGICAKGCMSGYFGISCTLRCDSCRGSCDEDTGECTTEVDESTGVQYWVGGGMAVVLIIAAVLVYIYRRLKRIHGVVSDVVKWQRRSKFDPPIPSENGQVDEEPRIISPRVCPIVTQRRTSYIAPRHSDGTLSVQSFDQQAEDLQAAAASPDNVLPSARMLQDTIRNSDELSDSYTIPHYCEVDEDMRAIFHKPTQRTEEPSFILNNSSFSTVADVHAQAEYLGDRKALGANITIPLIAECFENIDTEDSPHDKNPRLHDETYDLPFKGYMKF